MRWSAAGWMMLTQPTTAKKKTTLLIGTSEINEKTHSWKLSKLLMRDQPPDLQGSPSALAERAQQLETVLGRCSDSAPLADDGAGLQCHYSELKNWLRE
jgi:hypothetical protein